MSEFSSPFFFADAAGQCSEEVTPACPPEDWQHWLQVSASAWHQDPVELALEEFQEWIRKQPPQPAFDRTDPDLDVASVLNQFLGLRQEVNLLTRSTRSQAEQASAILDQYRQALDQGRQALDWGQRQSSQLAEGSRQASDEASRPLLKAMLDASDALGLAKRQVQRFRQNMPPPMEVPPAAPASPPSMLRRIEGMPHFTDPPRLEVALPFWARWLGLGKRFEQAQAPLHSWREEQAALWESWAQKAQTSEAESALEDSDFEDHEDGVDQESLVETYNEALERLEQLVESLITGYTMSLNRLERALEQQGLTPIPAVGQPFDPEQMEVVEVVRDPQAIGTVVREEVRRGYHLRGRIFRFAQVIVAQPPASS